MTKYLVRVTRSTDGEYADIEVKANNVEQAKEKAIFDARINEDMFFGERAEPRFYVDEMDEVEEVPPEGFA